jgi:hypothetical protein
MIIRKTMKNMEIYNTANSLLESFSDDLNLPVKINFYLQKNIKTVVDIAQDIEKTRLEIFDKYGTKDEETQQYHFDEDVIDTVNKEITDLFELEQEVKVNLLELDWFDSIDLSTSQVNAISFMIKEEEE